MSPWRATALVTRRELHERLRSRAFLASTAVLVVLLVAIVAMGEIAGGGTQTVRVGAVTAEDRAIAQTARSQGQAFDVRVEPQPLPDAGAARAAVLDDRVDLAVADGRLLARGDLGGQATAVVQSAAREVRTRSRLRSDGLAPERIERALDPPPLALARIGDDSGDGGEGLAAIASLLLYVAIFSFGYYVSLGVIEEKSSRVVEVILAAIEPRQLLAGKVLGIGLLGLLQLVVVGGVGLAVALATGAVDLPSATAATAALVAVCFLLGYALYAGAFAVAGVMVSRQEDSQSTTSPLIVLLLAGYFASVSALENPSSTLAQVCTFLPPVAPLVLPARAAQDALPAWELAASLALMLAFTVLLIRLAARIYERSILRLGAPLRFRDALRQARR